MESRRKLRSAFLSAACLYFVTVMATFSIAATRSPAKGHRVNNTGPIVVREGDVVQILNWKDGSVHCFKVTDNTTIRCDQGFLHGKRTMDASALVRALTVEVEAMSNPEIWLKPKRLASTLTRSRPPQHRRSRLGIRAVTGRIVSFCHGYYLSRRVLFISQYQRA